MKCPNCNSDIHPEADRCWRCYKILVPEPARPNADSVRVQRVVRLLARWRAASEDLWKQGQMWNDSERTDRANYLDTICDELAHELKLAGEEPNAAISDSPKQTSTEVEK